MDLSCCSGCLFMSTNRTNSSDGSELKEVQCENKYLQHAETQLLWEFKFRCQSAPEKFSESAVMSHTHTQTSERHKIQRHLIIWSNSNAKSKFKTTQTHRDHVNSKLRVSSEILIGCSTSENNI